MRNIAFLFSGQGAQYPGMGMEFYNADSEVKAVFDAAEKIRPGTLAQLQSDAETLKKTENTQPCLYLADIAAAIYLKNRGIKPAAAAGFSLGELPALAFCGAFSPKTGFELVSKRGAFMGEASQGCNAGMAAVLKLDNKTVENICAGYDNVYPVNYNSPGQVAVAGDKNALTAFSADVQAANGRVMLLNVSGGFHSPFMNTAAERFEKELEGVNSKVPEIPVYANRTAQKYAEPPCKSLARQINHPVLWEKTIRNMLADGIDTFIEVGAGNVLQKLTGKIEPTAKAYSVQNPQQAENVIKEICQC